MIPTTEKEMREEHAPSLKTLEELNAYITSLVEREHDYGTCVYAMSLAAVATFNYVAGRLGVTGFQASCADLDILRRTRALKGPFAIVDAEKMVYPQYDLREQLADNMSEWLPWVKAECARRLAELNGDDSCVHSHVKAHWERLATP